MGKKSASRDADWVSETLKVRPRRCFTCREAEAVKAFRETLEAIEAAGKSGQIALHKIYKRVCEKVPGFGDRVAFWAFRNHSDKHEPLWTKSRGGS